MSVISFFMFFGLISDVGSDVVHSHSPTPSRMVQSISDREMPSKLKADSVVPNPAASNMTVLPSLPL